MRIAVAYDNGNVFQHFGRTEAFKVYDVENGQVVSSQMVEAGGVGHEALAGLLADRSVDVLICGDIGGGAQAALEEAGVDLCAGAQGDADEAAAAYLKGEFTSTGANYDHLHHEEEEAGGSQQEEEAYEGGCGNGCGDGCGDGCGGCSGCGPSITGPNVGKVCRTHYRGTFNDGTQFDSSYDRSEPLEFTCGVGQMIYGFDVAVANMEVGQAVDIHLMPEEAYGLPDPQAIITLEIAQLPGAEGLQMGDRAYLTNQQGRSFPVRVTAKDDTYITFDANHEMAGKELNFHIELVEVQ